MCYLRDRVPLRLHHPGGDGVGAGLQAAVLAQETAHIHRVQEHLLAVLGLNHQTGEEGERGCQSTVRLQW